MVMTSAWMLMLLGVASNAFGWTDQPEPERARGPRLAQSAPVHDEDSADPTALLAEAQRLFDALEYEQAIEPCEKLLQSDEATIEQRLDAYVLQGSALAIVGRGVEAETAFRYLLRGRPDFDMGKDTPPKILAVFRKVQVEENAIRTQMAELERERLIKSLKLKGTPPEAPKGGLPVVFVYGLEDPAHAVRSVSVHYRRAGQDAYSSIPLERDAKGQWTGEIPGEWTQSEEPYELQYYVSTQGDDAEPLLQVGSEREPHVVEVAPGTLRAAGPFYTQIWFWGVTAAATAAVVMAGAGAVWALTLPPPSDLPVHRLP